MVPGLCDPFEGFKYHEYLDIQQPHPLFVVATS